MAKAKTKKVSRQLRLTTPVNATEKKRAERLARDEGYSVAELVRQLLAKRHIERLKKAAAKKARAAKKGVKSARSSSARLAKNALPLRDSGLATKPSRSNGARKRSSSSTTRRATKKPLKRGVVAASNKTVRTPRSSTKTGAA